MKERSLSPAHRKNFKLVLKGDMVVNRFKGHLGVFFESSYDGIVTFHYGVFQSNSAVYTKYYQHLFHAEAYKVIYAGASNGMTVGLQNLSNQNFYDVKSLLPPYEEQKSISEYVDSVERDTLNVINRIYDQILVLKEYKTTLINSAVTGKIRITPDMVEA